MTDVITSPAFTPASPRRSWRCRSRRARRPWCQRSPPIAREISVTFPPAAARTIDERLPGRRTGVRVVGRDGITRSNNSGTARRNTADPREAAVEGVTLTVTRCPSTQDGGGDGPALRASPRPARVNCRTLRTRSRQLDDDVDALQAGLAAALFSSTDSIATPAVTFPFMSSVSKSRTETPRRPPPKEVKTSACGVVVATRARLCA